MKLCIFPNDPLQAYFDKGEIKDRYYNPNNFFDEIHFITLTDNDVDVDKIQTIGGTAKIIIHCMFNKWCIFHGHKRSRIHN